MSEKVANVIKTLMLLGEIKTMNQTIKYNLAVTIVELFSRKYSKIDIAVLVVKDYI